MFPRKFDRYLVRQVLMATLFAVLVLSLVLVLGNLFKKIHELLVERGAPISFLWIFIKQVMPVTLVFTLPWGFLAAVLLVFGRLSSDQEINALRSSGMSLGRIAVPILLMGIAFSGFCYYLNANVAPHSKGAVKQLLYDQLKNDPTRMLSPSVVQSRLKGQRIYVESRNDDDSLQGFHAYQVSSKDPNAPPLGYIYAEKVASLDIKDAQQGFNLRLSGAFMETYNNDGHLQFAYADKIEPWVLFVDKLKQRPKPDRLSNQEISQLLADPPEEMEQEKLNEFSFEAVRRYAFSLAPLALAFVGIPLGLTSRRKETSSGLGISLGVALGYFVLTLVAGEMKGSDPFLSQILVWLPNLICLGLGIFLFKRASARA